MTTDPAEDAGATWPLIEALAEATARYPFKVWGFGESIAMEALLAAGGRHRAIAADLVGTWARSAPPLGEGPLAHVAPGVPLLELYEATREPTLLDRAHELAAVLAGTAVGSHGARIHRPDLAGWEREVWVDCMHLDGPFVARLGALVGDPSLVEFGADLLLTHARVLQDEASGLFSHGFDDATGRPNGVFWGRGQGWALLGLVDTGLYLLPDSAARREVEQRLDGLIAGLEASEATSGTWYTVVDHAETYLESSVGAFVALGVGRAVRRGLAQSGDRELADRAWAATLDRITPDGELVGVSDATPVGPDAARYGARPKGVFPWGQGPALLAAAERAALVGEDGRG